MEETFFFNSWMSLLRTLVIGISAYVAIICLLRISGKRTLSKMNAFDFIVTIALGSTLGSVLVTPTIALLDGILGFAILIFLQYIITWLSFRSDKIKNLIKSTPVMLYYRGNYLYDAMKKERVTKDEVLASIRKDGIGNSEDVEAVVIESDGSLTIIKKIGGDGSAMENVKRLGDSNH